MNNVNYDDKLKNIEFFKIHPELIPYVGEEFDTYKVLHIGESHYINQNEKNEKYGVKYFSDNWWNNGCTDMYNDKERKSEGWVNTKSVIDNYRNGKGAFSIFNNFVKSFSKVVLNENIDHISIDNKNMYKYFAFMNFFQMPSLYSGEKYWNSIYKSAKKIGNKKLASDVWYDTADKSTKIIDQVIDVLEPKAIVFTSISAGNAYKNAGGKYKDDKRVIYTSHPQAPFTWNKKLKSLGGKKGIEVFEEGLDSIYNNINA